MSFDGHIRWHHHIVSKLSSRILCRMSPTATIVVPPLQLREYTDDEYAVNGLPRPHPWRRHPPGPPTWSRTRSNGSSYASLRPAQEVPTHTQIPMPVAMGAGSMPVVVFHRRLPTDASRDEDCGKREVVWETARCVCVTGAHHDEAEEEPTATKANAVARSRPSVTSPPTRSTATVATARLRPAVQSHPNLDIRRIRGTATEFRCGSSHGTAHDPVM